MAKTKLTKDMQIFVVQRLACFDPPFQVIKDLKEAYGIDISHQALQCYDPRKVNGSEMRADLVELFETTRKKFIEDTADIGISHKSVRLRALERMAKAAEGRGNIALAKELYEQAAKESGGAYTNRREISGPGGKPLEAAVVLQTLDPQKLSTETIKELLAARTSEPASANN